MSAPINPSASASDSAKLHKVLPSPAFLSGSAAFVRSVPELLILISLAFSSRRKEERKGGGEETNQPSGVTGKSDFF